ncbi:hypothetical protein JHL21_03420 [Devosia sp. WQ 349]|uniref:hypothetical protein n=1 Tax=Devosia sp. WQ 349K1 TaxID=2800329 RepID=UPI0019062AD6|nr:hypothetical protein [Devosia sp. WQ 349K1]MBK1793541.1 hypothetical protein [Devosia sp. WQ 349K1]
MTEQTPTTIGAFAVTAANDNNRTRIRYDEDGRIVCVVRTSKPEAPRCLAKPHGLGTQPSLWKASADHDRALSEERQATLKYSHVMKRAAHWTDKPVPANDNQSWPLLQALRKDGNDAFVPVAERYRATHDRAMQEPLAATWHEDLYVVPKYANKADPENRTKGALQTAHTAGALSGGHVVRESSKLADKRLHEGTRNPPRRSVSKAREWHGEDNVAAVIDARTDLARYRSALGPLLKSFEDAVLHAATLTEVGESMGAASKTGGAVGKAVVMLGLQVVQEAMSAISWEQRGVA